jgi:hypothetical protein
MWSWRHGRCKWCGLKRRVWQIDGVDERKVGGGRRGSRGCGGRSRREVMRRKNDDPRWVVPGLLASVFRRWSRLRCRRFALSFRRCRRLGCLGFAFRLLNLSRDGNGPRRNGITTWGTEISGGGWRPTEGAGRRKRARLRCPFGGSGGRSRRGRRTWIAGSHPAEVPDAFEVWKIVRGAWVDDALPDRGWCRAEPGFRCRTKGSPGDGRGAGRGRSINVGTGRDVGGVGGMIGEEKCEVACMSRSMSSEASQCRGAGSRNGGGRGGGEG